MNSIQNTHHHRLQNMTTKDKTQSFSEAQTMPAQDDDSGRTKLLSKVVMDYLKVAVIPPKKMTFLSEHDVLVKSF